MVCGTFYTCLTHRQCTKPMIVLRREKPSTILVPSSLPYCTEKETQNIAVLYLLIKISWHLTEQICFVSIFILRPFPSHNQSQNQKNSPRSHPYGFPYPYCSFGCTIFSMMIPQISQQYFDVFMNILYQRQIILPCLVLFALMSW